MSSELIINASLPETRIALMEDGEIQELLIERASGKGIVGNIYKGRVTRVLPGMQAAFVDIGLEKAAFLYVDDVYVHSEIWEEEEGSSSSPNPLNEIKESSKEGENIEASLPGLEDDKEHEGQEIQTKSQVKIIPRSQQKNQNLENSESLTHDLTQDPNPESISTKTDLPVHTTPSPHSTDASSGVQDDEVNEEEDDEEEDFFKPVKMARDPNDSSRHSGLGAGLGDSKGNENEDQPQGTIAPEEVPSKLNSDLLNQGNNIAEASREVHEEKESSETVLIATEVKSGEQDLPESSESERLEQDEEAGQDNSGASSTRRRHRRGRRGGRFRRRTPNSEAQAPAQISTQAHSTEYPENYHEQVADTGSLNSDRSSMTEEAALPAETVEAQSTEGGRPDEIINETSTFTNALERRATMPIADRPESRSEFRAHRTRDRRIRTKVSSRPTRAQVNIQDLLKEGQEVLVQVAKDPIATKGARLTCHISLPGRHLVCMPTIDHVGVSRRIEREDERRRLREYVERNRPRNLGFIVRTASGRQQSEKRIKQDIEYLTRLWNEIREKAATITAPTLVYEDLNAVLRAVRDWVTEEIDKVIVDSRYHFNEILRFVSHFMPPLKQKVELYHGDIPIFDAYGISTELSRALERKVWLKSGGYIVIDQAEALVAIDVNTGRYVGKKNLEDTILKTNLEAVQEIAYQLRLRNCGGIIILDLIDMEKEENKQRVYRVLEEALSRDRARPTILKISELGLVEMTRKRTRDTIVRTLCESCTYCEGKGFIKSKQTVAYEVLREIEREGIERDVSKILVQAHPDVIDILAIDERDTLDQLERRYRKLIYLQAINDFHPEQFEVTADKRVRTDRGRDYHVGERSHDQHSERGHERGRHRHKSDNSTPIIVPVVASPKEAASAQESSPLSKEAEFNSGAADHESQKEFTFGSREIEPGHPADAQGALAEPNLGNTKIEQNSIEANSIHGQMEGYSGQGDPLISNSTDGSHNDDGFYDEEDRLAFLRAQAAQDAALARLENGHPTRGTADSSSNNRSVRGPRRNTRGRRGGKFRRGNDRTRTRGPKQYGYSQNSKWNETQKDASPIIEGESSNSSRNDTPSGGGSGGGTDFSQPPV